MSDAIAPVPISDETTRRLFGEPSFRVAKRGGYDPGDVAEFLERLGGQVVAFVGRLRDAESQLEVAETELTHWKGRARDAEATRETFERTLALAEDTANAAVADARHRAAGILTKAEADADELVGQARHQSFHMVEQAREEAQRCYADERLKMREEWQRLQDESAQLETLRLAVAAETMALEEVRNQLRSRIRMAATEMLKVAESPDCLGQAVTKGMPERPHPVAPPAPAAVAGAASAIDAGSITSAIEIAGAVRAAEATEVEATVEAAVEPAVEPQLAPALDGDDLTESAPTGFGDPAADAAFERFMSDEIEDEPSREWILAD
jgi:cell division septum initiation protein DivIVA